MRTTKFFLLAAFAAASAFSQCALVYNPFMNTWDCGGASGTVGGATNLTVAGAIPFVSTPGVLTTAPTQLFWDPVNFRLGVGTNTPSVSFQVAGPSIIQGLTVGRGGGSISSNTAVGTSALAANTTGVNSTAVGTDALSTVSTGNNNSAFGFRALRLATAGGNAAVGFSAGVSVSTGTNNTLVGASAGVAGPLTTGSDNVFVGFDSGLGSSTQRLNAVAIGSGSRVNASNAGVLGKAGMKWSVGGVEAPATTFHVEDTTASTGVTNVLVKAGAGQSTTDLQQWQDASGNVLARIQSNGGATIQGLTVGRGGGAVSGNTAVGASALAANTTGVSNVAVGDLAMTTQTVANNGTGVGRSALQVNTGSENTAIGYFAGGQNTTGTSNTYVGTFAGWVSSGNGNTTGTNNTYIGRAAGPSNSTQRSGSVAIGAGARVNASNAGVLGTAGMKWSVGGVEDPATTFHVEDTTATTGVTNVLVKAGSGQSTTPLLNIQNSAGTTLTAINSNSWMSIGTALNKAPITVIGSQAYLDLLVNQEFFTDLSGWTVNSTDWFWNSTANQAGGATHTTGTTTPLSQNVTVVAGVTYDISVMVFGRTAGSVTVSLGSVVSSSLSSNNVHARNITADTTGTVTFSINPTSDFDGTVRVVSLRSSGLNIDITNAAIGSNAAPVKSGIALKGSAGLLKASIMQEDRSLNAGDGSLSFGLLQGGGGAPGYFFSEVFRLRGGVWDGNASLFGTKYLTANVADGVRSNLTFSPAYSEPWTVTRHNYITLENPVLLSSAVLTDAAVFRFNAAAGTHSALASGTTRPSSEVVDAYVKINVNGAIRFIPAYSTTAGTAAAGSFKTVHVEDTTASTGVTNVLVKAGAGQSTTDLQQWQASGGTVLARVTSGGDIAFRIATWGSGTEGTCDATTRGQVVMVQGGAGVADTLRVCAKDAADAYAWTALY